MGSGTKTGLGPQCIQANISEIGRLADGRVGSNIAPQDEVAGSFYWFQQAHSIGFSWCVLSVETVVFHCLQMVLGRARQEGRPTPKRRSSRILLVHATRTLNAWGAAISDVSATSSTLSQPPKRQKSPLLCRVILSVRPWYARSTVKVLKA